jgi:hypothetical protein
MKRIIESIFGNKGRAARKPDARRVRPGVEGLEERTVLSVTATGPAADFQVNVDAGDTVAIGRTDNAKLRVTANGMDLPVQQAASSIEKLTINAANNAANTIDLTGLNPADFVSLRTVLVKIDARDTVNRGPGYAPAGSEVIDGQRYADFTQGNLTLKVTDFTPSTPSAPQARGIAATLVRTGRGRKARLQVRVSFADTGAVKQQFLSPYQGPKYRGVRVSVKDSNGDGVADTVVVSATRKGKTVTSEFPG